MSIFQHLAYIILWLANVVAAVALVFGPLITKTSSTYQSVLQGLLIFSLTLGVLGVPMMYVRYFYLGKEIPFLLRWFLSMGFLDKYVDQFMASPWFWVSPLGPLLLSLLITGMFYYATK